MCGRYTQTQDLNRLKERFEAVAENLEIFPQYNIAPTQNAPVVIMKNDRPEITLMRWGLVPFWAKDEKIGYKMINARAETLPEKRTFKGLLTRKRCLVPADGFYEWRKEPGKRTKTPLRFTIKKGDPFAFAGLWDRWKSPDGEELETFIIITTSPNSLLAKVHNRMPVLLKKADEEKWLNPDQSDQMTLLDLLGPYPAKEMNGYEVSTQVNSPRNAGPECIEPVDSQSTT
jgi:putative SOS response-associated peptidase YedK